MAGTGFLRTVNFGGFDKKDVLAYVDELNSKIYNLENEMKDKNQIIAEQGGLSQNIDGAEKYEAIISESRAKISELMGNLDTLKLEVSNLENELEERNSEIAKLKEERVMLEEKVESSKSGTGSIAEASFDIGSVFIEAKHSADRIITEAKNAAKKIEEDSRTLSQQIIDDANSRAETIINDAQTDFNSTISEAKEQANIIIDGTNRTKQSIVSSYELVATDIEKLANCLNDIVSSGALKLLDAKKLIEERRTNGFKNNQASMQESVEAEKKNSPIVENIVEKEPEPIVESPVVIATEVVEENVDIAMDNTAEETSTKSDNKFNIDLDLLAGLTAEIETNYNSGTYENPEESYISLNDDENKVSLLEDL